MKKIDSTSPVPLHDRVLRLGYVLYEPYWARSSKKGELMLKHDRGWAVQAVIEPICRGGWSHGGKTIAVKDLERQNWFIPDKKTLSVPGAMFWPAMCIPGGSHAPGSKFSELLRTLDSCYSALQNAGRLSKGEDIIDGTLQELCDLLWSRLVDEYDRILPLEHEKAGAWLESRRNSGVFECNRCQKIIEEKQKEIAAVDKLLALLAKENGELN